MLLKFLYWHLELKTLIACQNNSKLLIKRLKIMCVIIVSLFLYLQKYSKVFIWYEDLEYKLLLSFFR